MKFLRQWFNEGGLRELIGWLASAALAVYLPTVWAIVTAIAAAAILALAMLVQFFMRHPDVLAALDKKK